MIEEERFMLEREGPMTQASRDAVSILLDLMHGIADAFKVESLDEPNVVEALKGIVIIGGALLSIVTKHKVDSETRMHVMLCTLAILKANELLNRRGVAKIRNTSVEYVLGHDPELDVHFGAISRSYRSQAESVMPQSNHRQTFQSFFGKGEKK